MPCSSMLRPGSAGFRILTPTTVSLVPRSGWYCEIPLISEGVYLQIEQAESIGAQTR